MGAIRPLANRCKKKNIGWTGGIYSLQTQSVILKYLHRRKDD